MLSLILLRPVEGSLTDIPVRARIGNRRVVPTSHTQAELMSVRFSLDGTSASAEIDNVRWPVKQVIALATGAKRTRFQ